MADDIVISKASKTTVGFAITVCIAIFGFHMWLSTKFNTLENQIKDLNNEIKIMVANDADKWTATEHKIWEMQLRQNNPSLNVPDSDLIRKRK